MGDNEHHSAYIYKVNTTFIAQLPIYRQKELFTCPFCDHSSHYLLRVGHADEVLEEYQVAGGGRRYAKCLWCGSTDRDRLVYLWLKNHSGILNNKAARVLHIAPERCVKKVLKRHFTSGYTAADKFTKGYWYGQGTVQMDITNINRPADSFDLIVCNHVLEHIVDDNRAIGELHRVLKPGGTAIIQVPISLRNKTTLEDITITDPEQRKLAYGQFDHVRLYGQDYEQRLSAGGFKVQKENIAHLYPGAALNPLELLYVSRK